jgi:glycine betaine/proline transport system substrate-binding protein
MRRRLLRSDGRAARWPHASAATLLMVGLLVLLPLGRATAAGGTLILGGDGDPTNQFQRAVTALGLQDLGYTVNQTVLQPAVMYKAAATGDIDFLTSNWKPLQDSFYTPVADQVVRGPRPLVLGGAIQGYFIDAASAKRYHITNIGQLKNPTIAKLFAMNNTGSKAALCCTEPGWGAEKWIDYQIPKYGLQKTVQNVKGSYQALITATISRFKQHKPILFYTWTPNWVLAVFGTSAVQLQVPFPACPGIAKAACKAQTTVNGKDIGWQTNQIYVVMNKQSSQQNPKAWTFLSCLQIPMSVINNAILRQYKGLKDVAGLAQTWAKSDPGFSTCVKKAQAVG